METEYRRKQRKREASIYDEWTRLTSDPNNQRMAVLDHIRNKWGIAAHSTVYAIVKREEARRNG